MSIGGSTRPPRPSGRELVAGYFKNLSNAEKAVTRLRQMNIPPERIGVAMRSTDIGKNQDWIRSVRGGLGKPEDANAEETPQETLSGVGTPSAERFQELLREGGTVITVRDPDRFDQVSRILEESGADMGHTGADIGRTAAGTDRGTVATMPPRAEVATGGRGPLTREDVGEHRIQLMGEILRAHKDRVERGEVRLRKEIVTEKQNLQVPITREEIYIERSSATTGAKPIGTIGDDTREIRIPVTEERVTLDKEAVVTGEIRVQKRQVQETRNITGEVRHEELRVEKQGDVDSSITDRDLGRDAGRDLGKKAA